MHTYHMSTWRCAGYSIGFPFIKHDAFRGLSEKEINLYKYMFAPDLQPQTLAIIGCVAARGPHNLTLEMQGRFAVNVFKVRYAVKNRTLSPSRALAVIDINTRDPSSG